MPIARILIYTQYINLKYHMVQIFNFASKLTIEATSQIKEILFNFGLH